MRWDAINDPLLLVLLLLSLLLMMLLLLLYRLYCYSVAEPVQGPALAVQLLGKIGPLS